MTFRKLVLLALIIAKCVRNAGAEPLSEPSSEPPSEPPFKPLREGASVVAEAILKTESRRGIRCGQNLAEGESRNFLLEYVESLAKKYDNYNVSKGIQVRRIAENGGNMEKHGKSGCETAESAIAEYLLDYADDHVIKINLYDLLEDATTGEKIETGLESNSFAERSFGIDKLMVPITIGFQILKSVLFAMFLPSVLGNLARFLGESVKYLSAQGYGPSIGMGHGMGHVEDFEFKDAEEQDGQYGDGQTEGSQSSYSYTYPNSFQSYPQTSVASRFTSGAHKLNYVPNTHHHGSFYTKHNSKHGKRQSFKVFHNIPNSSLLLTNYDPFYSPLLSRMDSVFKQLGYETESCRERLICVMYKNPAKFAPYSNLISAQLSRELNELRKPTTDNPDILRFFKYMKAAKNGQDGDDCSRVYSECNDSRESIDSPMLKTYNEINKLVQARKLSN